ncbi:MAG: BatA domain-containing protein [Bacteroidia bacterium]|nr:BatA domain-containing protein [Bacteroidia bacterium]
MLAALAIPIIIHLFHFRRFKKVYFTNVSFLKEIKEEKSTRNKLRNLLVLLSRLLAFTALIFAFAQPFLSKDNTAKSGKSYVSIFVDNSNSMMASSQDVPLVDKARKKAEEIVNAYEASDQFQIVSHELKASQQRWLNQENTVSAIDEIEINPEVNLLSTILSRQMASFPEDGNHFIYILSDFQKSISDLDIRKDSTLEINLLPIQSVKENNISIDSVWFESVVPSLNQNNKLFVKLNNHGDEVREDIRVSLVQNGQTRPEGTIRLNASSSRIDTINLLFTQPGWQELEVRIDDYPIQFDDSYFLSFNIKDKHRVLSIQASGTNRYMEALFDGLNQFDLESVNLANIKYDKLSENDLIILSGLSSISSGLSGSLKSFIENGGNVLVFPAPTLNIENYNQFLNSLNANSIREWSEQERNVHKINTSEFVFQDVFERVGNNLKLPSTKSNYLFTSFSSRAATPLLQYRDGNHFLSKYQLGKGELFVCAAPLEKDYNDLVLNAEVFVPLLYKMAFATNDENKIAYIIGIDNFTEVNNTTSSNEMIYQVKGEDAFIPGQTNLGATTLINFNNMISRAGQYQLTLDNETKEGLAFNYDRLESNMEYMSKDELNDRYGENVNVLDNILEANLTDIIKEKDKGITLWRWCLILALIFLAIETLLLRFWKV